MPLIDLKKYFAKRAREQQKDRVPIPSDEMDVFDRFNEKVYTAREAEYNRQYPTNNPQDQDSQSLQEHEEKRRLLEEERRLLREVLEIEKQVTEETREQVRLAKQKTEYFEKYGQSEGMRATKAGIDLSQLSSTAGAYSRGEAYTRQSGGHTITYSGNRSGL